MAKKIDLSTITIERIIVHDIPKHNKDILTIKPNYSQQESKLSDGLRLFFKDKVVQALASDQCLKICFDDASDSPVSALIKALLESDGTNIVTQSHSMAKHLFEKQIGLNAAGILVFIFGKVNSLNTCIILKLERDTGAQLTLDQTTRSYNIAEVKDLMLTQKTKIFKVALLMLRSDFGVKFDGLIMDYQIDLKAKREVITWFMERFLGCRAFEDPKVTTQRFYNYTRAFILTVENEIDRIKYTQDLNSYVQKNTTTLNPKEFANDYFRTTQLRNEYKSFLERKHFKFNAFPKDTTQIERQIQKIVVLFENDISIIGNKGTFKDKVTLEKLKNGQTRAEVTSRIKKVV